LLLGRPFFKFIDKFNYDNKGLVARFKGVIWHRVKENGIIKDYRIVFQGVYGNYQIDVEDWPNCKSGNNTDNKLTCMVFIGNLSEKDEDYLKSNIQQMFILNDEKIKDKKTVTNPNNNKKE